MNLQGNTDVMNETLSFSSKTQPLLPKLKNNGPKEHDRQLENLFQLLNFRLFFSVLSTKYWLEPMRTFSYFPSLLILPKVLLTHTYHPIQGKILITVI